MPEEKYPLPNPCQAVCANVWRSIPQRMKFAFLASFVAGVLVYGFALTNVLICAGDSMNHVISSSNQIWLGRWSSSWLCGLGSQYSMPLVNGLLMIAAVSVLSAFVVDYLRLTSKPLILLASLILMCYPAVGNTLKYTYLADGFMIAAMLAVLALWITDRFRFGFLGGIPLLTLSLGTYQAYIALVVALMFVRGIQLLIEQKVSDRQAFYLIFRYAALFVGSLVVYYAATRVMCKITGIPLVSYQSVNSILSPSFSRIFDSFIRCYSDFFAQLAWLSQRPGYLISGLPNYVLLGVSVVTIVLAYLTGHGKTTAKSILLIILLALSPMLLFCIRMFNPETIHALVTYSVAGLYLLGVVLYSHIPQIRLQSRWLRAGLTGIGWLIILCIVVCVFVWSVGINIDFFAGKLDFTNMFAQASAYLTAAESTAGFEKGMPVIVIGEASSSATVSRVSPVYYQPKYFYSFMRTFLAVDMPFDTANAIDEQAKQISGEAAFQAMPCYPLPGSTAVINGAMVVKLSD